MRRTLSVLVCLAALSLCPAASAKTFYDVEIVVFENLDTQAGETERWKPQIVVPQFEDAAAFDETGLRGDQLKALPQGFRQLPLEQAQLDDAVERLDDSKRYRVLRHALWRQPALDRENAMPLRIHAGEPMTIRVPEDSYTAVTPRTPRLEEADNGAQDEESGAAGGGAGTSGGDGADATTSTTAPGDGTYGLDDSSSGGNPFRSDSLVPRMRDARVYPLDGTVELVVSRYLHVSTQLYYTTTVEWSEQAAGTGDTTNSPPDDGIEAAGDVTAPRIARGPDGSAMLSYPFLQQRRMRSGELHYLDHPVLGMLILVTPREEDEDPGSAATTGSSG